MNESLHTLFAIAVEQLQS